MRQEMINRIVSMEEEVVPTLFKPVQFEVIKKLKDGKKLNENEKRYLRGNITRKLEIIEKIKFKEDYPFLETLGSYYITGLEALKHNGYGWYFDVKIVEIINTKIDGKIRIGDKIFKFIRVKSIQNSKYKIDNRIKYASNEQISKDVGITKNKYVELICKEMFSRYGKMFSRTYRELLQPIKVDYSNYGVQDENN